MSEAITPSIPNPTSTSVLDLGSDRLNTIEVIALRGKRMAGASTPNRSQKRYTGHIEELNRRQQALLKPVPKISIPGTRLEPELHAQWESAAKKEGVSSSALVYVAVAEYLKRHEQRSVVAGVSEVAAQVAETGAALIGAMSEIRHRLARLDMVSDRLMEIVQSQESKFVTVEDLRALLADAGDQDEGTDEEPAEADPNTTETVGGQ